MRIVENINTVCVCVCKQNAETLNVKSSGTYSSHCVQTVNYSTPSELGAHTDRQFSFHGSALHSCFGIMNKDIRQSM